MSEVETQQNGEGSTPPAVTPAPKKRGRKPGQARALKKAASTQRSYDAEKGLRASVREIESFVRLFVLSAESGCDVQRELSVGLSMLLRKAGQVVADVDKVLASVGNEEAIEALGGGQ